MPQIPEGAVWAIFLAPLASLSLIAVFIQGQPGRRQLAGYVTVAAVGLSWLLAIWALLSVIDSDGRALDFAGHQWLTLRSAGVNLSVNVGLRVDGLTGIMLVVVTSVSLLVQIYSQGYMADDTGYPRYFAFMSLFTASMLGLVLFNSILLVYVTWELVGLCSYLLIGFWFHKPEAANAAKKAFLVTRLGDLGFLLAILLIWTKVQTFDIREIQELAVAGSISSGVITVFALGVFAGAVGKSAQFPLHVWLPDAMEGPTPVSALIHAATMVAAGVYLVARLFPVFQASDDAMNTVAAIGAVTALLAATIGLVVTDIKRVMAYSTISQLGYMMLALGVGGYVAGIFHLFTHAFFKALLFLTAGSVNHATNTFDMRKMGGLRRYMPITYAAMLIAGLSLAGVFPFAGFWSKDEILSDAWSGRQALFWVAMAVVFLTAFYMFRALFMTFEGDYQGGEPATGQHDHDGHREPHESPPVMAWPLLVLAVPAALAGFANIAGGVEHLLTGALPEGVELHETEFRFGIAAGSTALALAGIGLAAAFYWARVLSADAVRRTLRPLHTLLVEKYYLDFLYEQVIVARLLWAATGALALFDAIVIDGAVNGVATVTRGFGERLRRVQTGQLQAYGAAAFAGLVIAAALVFVLSG